MMTDLFTQAMTYCSDRDMPEPDAIQIYHADQGRHELVLHFDRPSSALAALDWHEVVPGRVAAHDKSVAGLHVTVHAREVAA